MNKNAEDIRKKISQVKSIKQKVIQELENSSWGWPECDELFDTQLQTLLERGCPKLIVKEFLEPLREKVIPYGRRGQKKVIIPFLPVIPLTFRGAFDLMSMVRYKNKEGQCCIDPVWIRLSDDRDEDKMDVEKWPYYIISIEYWDKNLNKNPWEVQKAYADRRESEHLHYRPLTIAETIALCIHTDILSWYDVWCCASFCHVGMPRIRVKEGQPVLECVEEFSSQQISGIDMVCPTTSREDIIR